MQGMTLMDRIKQIASNRYTRLGLLTVGLAVIFYLLLMFIFPLIMVYDFPQALHVIFALLGAGLVVYKFFAGRVF